jgi:hypothetical protein
MSWLDTPPPETRHPHVPGGQRVALRQGSCTLYNLLTDHPSLCSGQAWAATHPENLLNLKISHTDL